MARVLQDNAPQEKHLDSPINFFQESFPFSLFPRIIALAAELQDLPSVRVRQERVDGERAHRLRERVKEYVNESLCRERDLDMPFLSDRLSPTKKKKKWECGAAAGCDRWPHDRYPPKLEKNRIIILGYVFLGSARPTNW